MCTHIIVSFCSLNLVSLFVCFVKGNFGWCRHVGNQAWHLQLHLGLFWQIHWICRYIRLIVRASQYFSWWLILPSKLIGQTDVLHVFTKKKRAWIKYNCSYDYSYNNYHNYVTLLTTAQSITEKLIKDKKAYVDNTPADTMKQQREARIASACRGQCTFVKTMWFDFPNAFALLLGLSKCMFADH